jgi:flagellar hook-length control protein FliK
LANARPVDSAAGDTFLSEARLTELRAADSRAAEARPAAEPASPRIDLSRSGADQLTEVARRLPDGPVEVTLSPEELGKVRFAILGTEGQMSVQIVAERAETLDLLRRHIDVLESELRQQGYDQVSFSFGQGGGGQGTEPNERAPASDDDRSSRDTPVRAEPVARHWSGDGSLDLRL